MGFALRTDVDEGFAQLDAAYKSAKEQAIPPTLNVLRDRAATSGFRVITAKSELSASLMRKYTVLKFATPGDPQAAITVKGAGFPLVLFAPRQTPQGVSVRVKGRRFIIPRTFLLTLPNGHYGVFARGAYGGKSAARAFRPTGQTFGKFQYGKGTLVLSGKGKRAYLSINELFTLSPADAFDDPDVTQAMQDRIAQDAPAVLRNQFLRFKGIS